MPTGVYIRRIPESEKTRAKKSLAMKGNTHTKGHILTEEHKAKISVANKIACKGQHNKLGWHTPQETRIKLSEVHKGKKQSEEHRRNNSLAQMGRVKSAEERMKLSINQKRRWQNPQFHQRMVKMYKELWQDKGFAEKRQRAMKQGMNLRPNKPESKVLEVLDRYFPNEWKYTGDGSFFIAGLNPDFVNINGKKIAIEVFGDYWHGKRARNYKETEQGRAEIFAKYGFDTLILWEKEINKLTELELSEVIRLKTRAKHQLPDGEEINHETKRSY